jgi:hypothetical protein
VSLMSDSRRDPDPMSGGAWGDLASLIEKPLELSFPSRTDRNSFDKNNPERFSI